MKNVLLFLAVLFLVSVVNSSQVNAQQTSAVSKYKYDEKNSWNPVKVQSNGMNILNGVMFLQKSSTSKSQAVFIIKIINMNSYPVKIQWEETAGVMKEIVIPANSVAVGNSDATDFDSNESKLMVSKPISEEAKQLMLSTLSVIEIK